VRERSIQLLVYGSGIVIVFVAAAHLVVRALPPFEATLAYGFVLGKYQDWLYLVALELLLVTVSIHAFIGLRVVLIEWRQGRLWERITNWATVVAIAATIAFGTRTILLVNLFG
jgi:succinate dehydrogenase / fumarate reductase membrane anchor subunit